MSQARLGIRKIFEESKFAFLISTGTHESALTASGKNLFTRATHQPICPKELGAARKFHQNPFSDFSYVT